MIVQTRDKNWWFIEDNNGSGGTTYLSGNKPNYIYRVNNDGNEVSECFFNYGTFRKDSLSHETNEELDIIKIKENNELIWVREEVLFDKKTNELKIKLSKDDFNNNGLIRIKKQIDNFIEELII